MFFDVEPFKIEIHPGQNDISIPPTPNKAGNGSHLISRYNSVLDEIQSLITEIDLASRWTPIFGSHTIYKSQNLIIPQGSVYLELPPRSSSLNDITVGITVATSNAQVQIASARIMGNNYNEILVNTGDYIGIPIYFVWAGFDYGWVCSRPFNLTLDGQPYTFSFYNPPS